MTKARLKGGVIRNAPRSGAPKGSLYDCLNYEVNADEGYSSLEGFERFDGHISPSTRDIWEATLANDDVTPAYMNKSVDISNETAAPHSVCIGDSGTKMYVLGDTSDKVYQYTLSPAWDASTAVYTGKFYTVTEETNVFGMAFSTDGTKMYISGSVNKTIYQYTLSTAWDVSTASYASKSLDVSGKETGPRGLAFKTDGTEVYVTGTNSSAVHQYTLSTAWDISSGTFTVSFTLDPGESTHQDISFIDTGLIFYVIGSGLDTISWHTCATAWDLSTAADYGSPFSVATEENVPTGLFFKPDGLSFYVVGGQNKTVYQYSQSFSANENMTWVDGSETGDLGVVISTTIGATNTVIRFSYWNSTDALPSGAAVTGDDSGASFSVTPVFAALQDIATNQGDYFDQLYAASTILRSAITPVPGSGVVLGIKWYKNQQTAVRDYFKFVFSDGDIAEPQIGQHVLIADGNLATYYGDEGIVRDIDLASGSFSLGTGAGCIVIEPLTNSFTFGVRLGTGAFDNTLITLSEVYFTSGSNEPVVDDQLTGQTSSNIATVYRVELHSGAWADNDAAGVIYCTNLNGEITSGELMDNTTTTTVNVLTAGDVNFGASGGPNINYASANNEGHALAGLYRSSRLGWNKVDLGWELRFNTGTNEPTAVQFGADTDTQVVATTDWMTPGTQRDLTGWTASAGSEIDAVNTSGGAYVYPSTEIGHQSVEEAAFYFAVHNFGFDLPEGARVVGVEIEVTAKNTAAATSGGAITKVQPFTNDTANYEGGVLDGVIAKRQALGDLTNAQVAYTFGGANDLWDTILTKDVVESSDFGMKFKLEWAAAAAGTALQCDYIRMRVHYVEQGSLLYFYDTVATADYTTARLVNFNLEDGTWAGNDAVGTMHIYTLLKGQIPTKNIQIRDTAAGAGNLIANLDGNESLVSLPGSALLATEKSKYQMIAENVYARDDLEAIYAANGAGPAFSYDGFYMRYHRPGLSPDLDKPRHVSIFQFRLWLGYKWGELAISVGGDPTSFDGTLNAVSGGVGKIMTGLSPWNGQTLGVFTKGAIFGIKVNGDDFDQQTISPKAGAIEYTIQDMGSTPLFTDSRGVSMANITERYGDFELGRLTQMINSWLLPRLQNKAVSSTRNRKIVNATLARAKNQYRAYFADGNRMTVTMNEVPEITFQKLYTDGTASQFIRVLATDSDVDDLDTDRIFFTMDVNPNYDHGDDLGYVYEDDRGTSFDGGTINRWFELSSLYGDTLEQFKWVNVPTKLYGKAHGHADLSLSQAEEMAHPSAATGSGVTLGDSTETVRTELDDFVSEKNRITGRGKLINFRIEGTSNDELPHLLQEITILNEKAGRKDT